MDSLGLEDLNYPCEECKLWKDDWGLIGDNSIIFSLPLLYNNQSLRDRLRCAVPNVVDYKASKNTILSYDNYLMYNKTNKLYFAKASAKPDKDYGSKDCDKIVYM